MTVLENIGFLVLRVDGVVSAFLGLSALLFPWVSLTYVMTIPTDGVHWHICRVVGSVLLGQGYSWWRLTRSSQKSIKASCYVSRLIGATFSLFVLFHGRTFYPEVFIPAALKVLIRTNLGVILVYLTLLLGQSWPISDLITFRKSWGFNRLILFDGYAAIAIGVAWIAIPDLLLHRQVVIPLQLSHLWLGRYFGALLFSSYIISHHTVMSERIEDRRYGTYARMIINLGVLLSQIYSQVAYHSWWSAGHWVGTGLYSFWSVLVFVTSYNVATGYFQ